MKTIFTIATNLPGSPGQYIKFNSSASVLDADVVLIRLDMTGVSDYDSTSFRGKLCYGEHSSFELRERIDHWQRELRAAAEAGKTVFVLLNDKTDVFIESGEKTHSGTGRNMKTTHMVVPFSNYNILPLDIEFTSGSGKVMVLPDKPALLREYWEAFASMSQYKTIIRGAVTAPLVLSKDKKSVLGALLQPKGTSGHYVLLPDVDFTSVPGLTGKRDGKSFWTKEAVALGQRYIQALLAIDERLRSSTARTPPPAWTNDRQFDLAGECRIRHELSLLEQRKEELQHEEAKLKEALAVEGVLKALLFEQGKPLETAIIRALGILGFTAAQLRAGDSEFDVVFSSREGRFIGEAEGKDSKPINIDKLRQLEMNIHEDLERIETKEPAKAVLFGNAMRLTTPTDRGEFFTDKCRAAAKRNGCALVRTPDLFVVAKHLSETPDQDFATKCRQAILNACGEIVMFPIIGKSDPEERDSTPTT